jgi:glutamate/tyrosine decarboxylase-like PLP-dependent enzyme
MSSDYPYADRYPVNRTFPETGRARDEILDELRTMATEEDASWEGGKCSGTMYCGDHSHYAFLTEAFGLYAHMNALQRDMCPSATRFEGEIIAMALDLFNADARTDTEPVGLVTSGGTGSITHAMLAYREHAAATRDIKHPNVVKPETAHPAFEKACHLFGIELRSAPIDPESGQVIVDELAKLIDDDTVAIVGSACNYGYGIVDPIAELGQLALDRGVGLHVDC